MLMLKDELVFQLLLNILLFDTGFLDMEHLKTKLNLLEVYMSDLLMVN